MPKGAGRRLSELSASDLRGYTLAGGIPIPRLSEVLEAVGDRATVYVEIKAPNIEAFVVRCIRESNSSCAVHSFDHRIIQTVKKLFPAIRAGVLQVARHLDPITSLVATGADDLWQHVDYIDEDLVSRAHSIGARVVAWTANDSAQWKLLRELRVDAICTDNIARLAAFSS